MDSKAETKLKVQGVVGAVIKDGVFKTCISAPTSLTIPKEIKTLGRGCLSGQDNLERIILSSSVIEVEDYCLANCPNLKVIRIHKGQEVFIKTLTMCNKARVEYVPSSKERG